MTGEGAKYKQASGDPYIYKEEDENPEIAELLEGAKKVLKSGNRVAFEALERNIRYFSHAVAIEKRLEGFEKTVLSELSNVKTELNSLKAQRNEDRIRKEDPLDGKNEIIKRRAM